jgi:hypothetical protein
MNPIASGGQSQQIAADLRISCGQGRGIEPATFRFSGGVLASTNVFQLVVLARKHRAERVGAPGPRVWPHFGPMDYTRQVRCAAWSTESVAGRRPGE